MGSYCIKAQQGHFISGKLTDAQLQPVPNATIYVLNTHIAAISNEKGEYQVGPVTPGKYTLTISATGYATIAIDVEIGESNTPLKIVLPLAAKQLEAVMVTAQKKDEIVQRIPFSISTLSSVQVRDYRLWNTHDLTAIVPNLYSADPGDGRNVTSIRGITSTSYDPAIATYIDGVDQFGLDTYIPQLFDIERIEVLRGPQGTLYGRNAMGGVINIITRQPSNHQEGFAEITIGNDGIQRYGFGYRTPLVKNKLFFGIAGVYDGRNGFYSNDFNNTSFDKQHSFTGNYFLKYMANAQWTILLNVKHHNNRNNGAFPLVNGVSNALQDPFHLDQDAVTKMIDNTFNSSLSANYVGKAFNFSSQTSYQSNHRYYIDPIDGDFSPADAVTIINNYGSPWNKVKVATQEFKFTSPASASTWKWTGGVYFFYQDNPVKQATHFGKDAALVGAPDSNFSIINTTKGKSYGGAVYGQVTWAMNSKIDVTVGLRYDHETQQQHVLSEYQHDPNPMPSFSLIPDTSGSVSFYAFSPKLGFTWHVTDETNMYITYSRGYRPGGLTPVSSDPSQPPLYQFKPEYSDIIEVGLKNYFWNKRVIYNLSAFSTFISDAQVPTLVLPNAITVTKNAGRLGGEGVELELAVKPGKGWEGSWNLGLTDVTYRTLKLSSNGTSINLAGKQQVFTPDATSSFVLQYNHPIKKDINILVRGEWFYIGKQYFDLANTIAQDQYSLFNTRFGISMKHLEIMCWMRNIGDKKYISYAYDFGAVHLGNPRTFGITFSGRL